MIELWTNNPRRYRTWLDFLVWHFRSQKAKQLRSWLENAQEEKKSSLFVSQPARAHTKHTTPNLHNKRSTAFFLEVFSPTDRRRHTRHILFKKWTRKCSSLVQGTWRYVISTTFHVSYIHALRSSLARELALRGGEGETFLHIKFRLQHGLTVFRLGIFYGWRQLFPVVFTVLLLFSFHEWYPRLSPFLDLPTKCWPAKRKRNSTAAHFLAAPRPYTEFSFSALSLHTQHIHYSENIANKTDDEHNDRLDD